jgi:hypothetical protein
MQKKMTLPVFLGITKILFNPALLLPSASYFNTDLLMGHTGRNGVYKCRHDHLWRDASNCNFEDTRGTPIINFLSLGISSDKHDLLLLHLKLTVHPCLQARRASRASHCPCADLHPSSFATSPIAPRNPSPSLSPSYLVVLSNIPLSGRRILSYGRRCRHLRAILACLPR